MAILKFDLNVECYVCERPLTIDEGSFLVDFNVRSGVISPLNPDRVRKLVGKLVYLWPSNSHISILSFHTRKGKLRDRGRGKFELQITD